ncbi:hypothetical protein LZZ85_11140 [Terrimonas sp. NA20]|uniref:Uncharacterized protein n=1 Tax=Terrimonas ginsenosidimutans TaxID=2908004 RepID=A0ABS9KR82_9BACT|nr:hypothetical protein [Terrimonas ginsenosidimutans]MCG2614842.1 hypothetical protein [Terrimonas ginsenosidimutans]
MKRLMPAPQTGLMTALLPDPASADILSAANASLAFSMKNPTVEIISINTYKREHSTSYPGMPWNKQSLICKNESPLSNKIVS